MISNKKKQWIISAILSAFLIFLMVYLTDFSKIIVAKVDSAAVTVKEKTYGLYSSIPTMDTNKGVNND